MLLQLMDGRAYTAMELARVAGVTPQTASTHLRRLVEGDLLVAVAQGRHRYHQLASSEVAEMLEGILRVADRTPSCTAAAARSMPALREARSCYRHLAGVHAVAITDRLLQAGHVLPCEGHWQISAGGAAFLAGLGLPLRELLQQPVAAAGALLPWLPGLHRTAATPGRAGRRGDAGQFREQRLAAARRGPARTAADATRARGVVAALQPGDLSGAASLSHPRHGKALWSSSTSQGAVMASKDITGRFGHGANRK